MAVVEGRRNPRVDVRPLSEAPGEAEAREAIPDPKKPKLWEVWISLGLLTLFLVAGMLFSYAGMELNSRICTILRILTQIYFFYALIVVRR